MGSPLPKVLHPVAGKPMLARLIEACREAQLKDIRVVLGHGAHLVQNLTDHFGVRHFMQDQPLGTGDAVKSAQLDSIQNDVLILNGDHPLVTSADILSLITQFQDSENDMVVVSTKLKDPKDFGRIVRSQGKLRAIVEAKEAAHETLKINEVNTGIYMARIDFLKENLPKLSSRNSKNEFYLTDLVSIGIENGDSVGCIEAAAHVGFGVNTQAELAKASRIVFRRKIKKLMEQGVLILDPKNTYIEDNVSIGAGSVIYPSVFLRGTTRIGTLTAIEPFCYLIDCEIADQVLIRANSYLEKCSVKARAQIGPFTRLRPETQIGEEAHVGNFVEMKKVKFGKKSKAGHLSYLGDAEIGEETNIGCGTITCNYAPDKNKYKTKIGDRVFVGSDSQLIAPIEIGNDVVVASGSTLTKSVPDGALAIARSVQTNKENYAKKFKKPSLSDGGE